jgi:hypothetical protein
MDRLINLAEQLLNDVTAATQRSVVLWMQPIKLEHIKTT